jgi:translation elongation factor EF-G
LGAKPRLVQGQYLCTIYSGINTYGKVCEVISKKKGRVLESDYQSVTNMYVIKSNLPVQESIGFYDILFT